MNNERMGDYYANLRTGWGEILCSDKYDCDIVSVASRLFLGRLGSPPRQGWCDVQRAALIGDAFAYGALKYGKVGDWRDVPLDHHLQAAGRHFHAWLQDPASVDAESGLTNEAHFLARAVMIQWLRTNRGGA